MTKDAGKLAILGGRPLRTKPFDWITKHTVSEWRTLRGMFERGVIPMTRGPEVNRLRELFCKRFGMKYAVTASSGTAAIHTALAAVGVGRGDEVITCPWTDMGSLAGILQLNAVPVFADVDPATGMMTAQTVAAKITPRTRAVEVVHLGGIATDAPGIVRLCRPKGIAVVEDCAQSYLCTWGKRIAGTIGDIGCWSMNEAKHLGTGDGGILMTNNRELARRADLFADKCYDREGGPVDPFFAPVCYRLNAMAAQVGCEQFKLIDKRADRRHRLGTMLDAKLREIPGITPRKVRKGDYATYWHYAFRIDPNVLGCTNIEFAKAVTAEGVECNPSRVTGVLAWSLFRNDTDDRHACSYHCPLYKGPKPDYNPQNYPGLQQICLEMVTVALASTFSVQDTLDMARCVAKVAKYYARSKA